MIKLTNTDKVIKSFGKYADSVTKELGDLAYQTGQEIETKAKELAPVNKEAHGGNLKLSIRSEKQTTDLHYKITAYMPYAAYMEFGTGAKNVKIPRGFNKMAGQFKGAGIKEGNINPKPFMYPAFLHGRRYFRKDLKEILKYWAKQFNK